MLEFVKIVECKSCHKRRTLQLPLNGYLAWRHGLKHIQDALPQIPAGDRELLVSGMCEKCFDSAFAEDNC